MAKAHRASFAVALRQLVLAVLVLAAVPVLAQEAQGPPDGFIPPASDRVPAQGSVEKGAAPLGGIVPLGPPLRPEPRPAPPALPPAEPAPNVQPGSASPQRASPGPAPVRAAPPRTDAPAMPAPNGATPVPPPAAVDVAPSVTAPLALPSVMPLPDVTVPWWRAPWMLAAAAVLVSSGIAVLFWRRRRFAQGPAPEPAVHREPPSAKSPPAPVRRPLPVPERPQAIPAPSPPPPTAPPLPLAPAPVPLSVPAATGRARLTLSVQLDAMEMTRDAAQFRFTLTLANSGDRDAVGGLVRIALQQAHPGQAAMLDRFFDGAGGSVLAEDVVIAAGDVGTIVRQAVLPLASVEPMLIGGYPSLVPVIGFDTSYHWDGDTQAEGDAFGQVAAAFVIGTASAADGRVAPVRLDHGPRRLTNPVARLTEMQRMM